MLVLKALALGPMPGYGVVVRIEQLSRGVFPVNCLRARVSATYTAGSFDGGTAHFQVEAGADDLGQMCL